MEIRGGGKEGGGDGRQREREEGGDNVDDVGNPEQEQQPGIKY